MLSAGRTFPFGEKAIFSHNQKQLYKKPKKLLHIFSKEKEKEFSFCKHKSIRTNQKQKLKFFFFSILLLKQHSFKSNKSQRSQFSSQEYNQNSEHPLKGKSILHQHLFSTPFFIVFFNYFV